MNGQGAAPAAVAARALPAVALVGFLVWFGTAFAEDQYWLEVGVRAMWITAAVVGLNLLLGHAGLLSLGHYAFFVFGGFVGAVWAVEDWGLSPWLGAPVAFAAGMLVGALLALTCCHLRGFYLTVVTLAFGLISSALALLFNGAFAGINGRSVLEPLDTNFSFLDETNPFRPYVGLYWLGVALLLTSLYLVWNISRSRVGRAYHAIRESELAARACGVPTYWYKVSAFSLSAGIVSAAGVLAAQYELQVTMVEGTAIVGRSFEWVIYAFFGGLGTLAGPVLGAFAFTLGYGVSLGDKSLTDRLGEWDTLFTGVLVIAITIAAPEGFVGVLRRVADGVQRPLRGRIASRSAAPVRIPPDLCVPRPRHRPDPAGAPVLRVSSITKRFGGLAAVSAVDLDLASGRIHALIGPNGSGKSTLVNLVTGIYRPDGGRVEFRGRDLGSAPPQRRNHLGIARTFQTCQIWRRLSVLDNVMVGAHARLRTPFALSLLLPRFLRPEERRAALRAWGLLHFVGLADRGNDPAGALPFADQRRLEIARALASDPDLLILDEPAAGMHPREVQDLVALILAIRDEGVSVLLIEHHMDVVMGLSDRVTVIDHGEKIAEGPPEEVSRDPVVVEAYLGAPERTPARARETAPPAQGADAKAGAADRGEPLLAVRGLQVQYGAARALLGVDLDVYRGEIVALIGGNGAGKSTSLKTVSGVAELLKSVQGEITFLGERVERRPAHRIARMGMAHVPEGRRVFPDSTVEENLLLGGYRASAAQVRAGLDDAYARFPILAERRNQMAGLLSGGEQQMLAIARGLVSRPQFLLLDEPSLGLGPIIVDQVFAAVGRLAQEGTTILLVEQMATKALAIADRAYILESGSITLEGPATVLADDPLVQAAYLGAAG